MSGIAWPAVQISGTTSRLAGPTSLDLGQAIPHNPAVQHETAEEERLPASVLMIYGLAAIGGAIGYVPLLTLLLPIKVEALHHASRYGVLAWCGIAGAVTAGGANIGFGWLGDRSVEHGGGRRRWLFAGAAMTALSFTGITVARDAVGIVASIVAFQVAINALLAQMVSIMADEVPATQKGSVAALLTLGHPVAAAASALILAGVDGEGSRLAVTALLMIACIAPLLIAAPRRLARAVLPTAARPSLQRGLGVAWATRLLMQIATSGVGLYLLFYFEGLNGGRSATPASLARLLVVAAVLPVPVALLLGRWSDSVGRRAPFLAGTAAVATLALFGLASAGSWAMGAIAYLCFACGAAAFLALNMGQAMLLLPDGARRGRDLGLLNLANTIPQIVAPLLAWWWATAHDLGLGMALLALLTLSAGLLPMIVADDR